VDDISEGIIMFLFPQFKIGVVQLIVGISKNKVLFYGSLL